MYKRITLIGMPGSGKSTLGKRLSHLLNLPLHHLDTHIFIDGKRQNQDEFIRFQEMLVKHEEWIIEGCSISTLEMRLKRSDLVIYLDYPRRLCLWRLFKRQFSMRKRTCGALRFLNFRLLKYVWNFDKEKRGRIEVLRSHYSCPFYLFKSPQETEGFLTCLEKTELVGS